MSVKTDTTSPRFGNVQRVAEPGLVLKIPFVEGIKRMDTRVQKEEVESSGATKDLQDVNAKLALNYSIGKETALNIYKELGTNYKDNIVVPALHESFKAGVAQYTAENLITNRSEAKEKILAAIEAKAVAQQEVEKAKQDLEKAKIEAEKKKTEAEAEAEAQRLQQSTLTDLMVKKMYIEKWNGQLPTTATGNAGLMINLGE